MSVDSRDSPLIPFAVPGFRQYRPANFGQRGGAWLRGGHLQGERVDDLQAADAVSLAGFVVRPAGDIGGDVGIAIIAGVEQDRQGKGDIFRRQR